MIKRYLKAAWLSVLFLGFLSFFGAIGFLLVTAAIILVEFAHEIYTAGATSLSQLKAVGVGAAMLAAYAISICVVYDKCAATFKSLTSINK